jgi:hypothetical protein
MDPDKPERWFEPSRWDAVPVALLFLALLTPLGAWLMDCTHSGSPTVHLIAEALYPNGAIVLGGILFVAALWRCFAPRRP